MLRRTACLLLVPLIILGSAGHGTAQGSRGSRTVTTGTLLDEMIDLAMLARFPDTSFKTVQFSSYDRRSVSPESGEWFSNSDGFGREPIPGFLEVLSQPDSEGVGLYLLADVKAPGAIVRGWSAGMGGVLRVYLDGARTPLYEGPAYDFLARKSSIFLERAGLDLDCRDTFSQQDADYLPVPFGRSLKVTWEGNLNELHFYHLEVRLYDKGTRIATFQPEKDLPEYRENIRRVLVGVHGYGSQPGGVVHSDSIELTPDGIWEWTTPGTEGGGAITGFTLRFEAPDVDRALRGTLLQIAFDGASRPQVEAPAGDFFGSGPGINVYDSLPFSVSENGGMTCRFFMPYREKASVRLLNTTGVTENVFIMIQLSPWQWDDRSLHFHSKWRTDNDVDLRTGPLDMPFVLVRGRGRLVGSAVMVVNPSATPTPGGNWWGEGDEKIFVDDESFPSFFGTGSEDYFNYSWSRPDLFDHPYCGQPLDTGPGNLGYVSNHRWHILDSVPFRSHLAFYMELWHHNAFPGLCYARTVYFYAQPGAIDDHRRIQLSELVIPELPTNEPQPLGGARNSTFHHFEEMEKNVEGGMMHLEDVQPGASRSRLLCWYAEEGDRFRVTFKVNEEGEYALNLVAARWPEAGMLRLTLDGEPLVVDNLGGAAFGERGWDWLILKSHHARRLLSTGFTKVLMEAGEHELAVECIEGGRFGFDYIWIQER